MNPLDGPFPTSADLTGYSDEPGYAKVPRDVASGYDFTARVLARLDRALTRKAAA